MTAPVAVPRSRRRKTSVTAAARGSHLGACDTRCVHAQALWGVVLGAAAVGDVLLIRGGHSTLSSVCRRSLVGRVVAVALTLHLVRSWKRDPLSLLGARIAR
jgi:hypothetical protein